MDLHIKLADLGALQSTRYVLPQVAVEVAQAAERGLVDEDDAAELYLSYWHGTQHGAKIDARDDSPKAQISKLRQIIKAADTDLLDRVTKVHDKCKREGIAVYSLYASMVECSRVQAAKHAKLWERDILAIIKK